MWIVPIGWLYVVLMMALAEALSSQGTVLGAVFTFLLYGLLPLALVMYILGTPMRRKASRDARAAATASIVERDRGSQPAGDPVAAKGEEP
jgi:hypothetical protein